ncbi:MAG TPA: hypothetical protein VD731_08550 [Nitrosopumilaceae archaeon]|nr:hypothetical protein [Nitrosopumilaceae archaeon]
MNQEKNHGKLNTCFKSPAYIPIITKIITATIPPKIIILFVIIYDLGIERLWPVIPEIMLPIPLKSSPIERYITIKTRVKLGNANKIIEKAITIPPMITFAIREALFSVLDAIPFPISPNPWIKMKMVITITSVKRVAIGCAIEKNPPPMEIIPIIILIMREPFDNCLTKTPSIIFEIPTIIKEIPINVTKNKLVVSGLAKTAPDSAIVIAPSTIWAILNQVGDFSRLKDMLESN